MKSSAPTGLLEIVRAAAAAVSGGNHEPVGRLEVVQVARVENAGQLCIEANVSAHGVGWTVEQLDVRVQWQSTHELSGSILRELLELFGSHDFVSFTLLDGAVELMDFTLSFSSKVPFLATNELIAHNTLSSDQAARCDRVLEMLGLRVSIRERGSRLHRTRFRRRLKFSTLIDAFRVAISAGLRVVLYASTLPTARSVRLAQGPGDRQGTRLDICISLGFGSGQVPSERVVAVEHFLQRAFNLSFDNQHWEVRNAHARAEDFRARSVIAARPRSAWSLTWGQRKSK